MKSWLDYMLRHSVLVIGLASLLGCGNENAAPTPKNTVVKKEFPPSSTVPAEKLPEEKTPLATEEEAASGNEIESLERIVLLTPGGPLVMDVSLTIADRPHTEIFQDVIKRVLEAGDTDDDGRSTWQEWQANEEFMHGELAAISDDETQQVKQWIERYDENKDDQIQPEEAASWLGRNGNSRARAFSVRSSRSFLALPASTSRVWQLLDCDDDGLLLETEIQHAPERFWLLDANDDRAITLLELASLKDRLDMVEGQPSRTSRSLNRYGAIHLEEPLEVDRLDSLLSDLYAPRQNLGPESFPELPGLFRNLDLDQNERLDREELAKLLSIEPMLKLSINFSQSDETARSAKLQVDDHADEIRLVSEQSENRVVFALGKTRLIVSAHDLVGGDEASQVVERSQIRLMVHDQCDALFRELDVDGDERLGEREVELCNERMLDCDANGDRQIANDELPYPMIVAFLRGEQPSEQSFYVPRFESTVSRAAEKPAWFLKADFNGDGDVSRREFLGPGEQFSKIDSNQDSYISSEEAVAFTTN